MNADARNDLPHGFRWANADETEEHMNVSEIPGAVWIQRTVDRLGNPYPVGTVDLAVPRD